jgi:hypothetical protein
MASQLVASRVVLSSIVSLVHYCLSRLHCYGVGTRYFHLLNVTGNKLKSRNFLFCCFMKPFVSYPALQEINERKGITCALQLYHRPSELLNATDDVNKEKELSLQSMAESLTPYCASTVSATDTLRANKMKVRVPSHWGSLLPGTTNR